MTARELEREGAAAPASVPHPPAPAREPLAMLVRRGFSPSLAEPDLPFDLAMSEQALAALADALDHYAFRLFLRGAIQRPDGLVPEEATRFLTGAQAAEMARTLRDLGLSEPLPGGRFRLRRPAASFGGTLEWYVAHRLAHRYGLDAAFGVKFHAPGVGGDLDVVASAEGKLVVLELKSSPPKHIGEDEVSAFFDRLAALRPDVAIFAVDTALRLADRVVPLVAAVMERRPRSGALGRRTLPPAPKRVERDLWALTPHVYLVSAKPSLIGNLGRALAEGLRALAPEAP